MKRSIILIFGVTILLSACGQQNNNKKEQSTETVAPKDFHTQSNAQSITIKHLDLDIKVDFIQRQISGRASWDIDNPNQKDTLQLDTYGLTIDSITANGSKLNYSLAAPMPHLGSQLSINISPSTNHINIYYKTGADARALQWLTPQQTLGKTNPFLYTQSESIYARSWIPAPDGPGIRFTYTAKVDRKSVV